MTGNYLPSAINLSLITKLEAYFLVKVILEAFYFHVNGSIGIVQKIEFEIRPDLGCMYNLQNVEKSGFRQSVCVFVRVCVCV